MKYLLSMLALLFVCTVAIAQKKKPELDMGLSDSSSKHPHSLSIGTGGISIRNTKINDSTNTDEDSEDSSKFKVQWGMLDLGINKLDDKSDYKSAAVQNFLNVPAGMKNSNLFDLREGKSINVNIYPVMFKYDLLKTKHQKIELVSGVGLQLYNFRFNQSISYVNKTAPGIFMDTVHFSKNKLAFDYLMIPLMLDFKTKLGANTWLVYGFGVSGGYRLSSWTKQISTERGKQKDHDKFDFSDFNNCLNAEIGLSGYFRLYATYQLSALQAGAGLEQHPFCIGIRFFGI
ncbi:MAG: hypothetical protein WCG87_06220 [Bacteroidota bacterium]